MKVLQINTTLNVGSTGRIVEQIAAACLQEQYQPYVAYGRRARASCAKTYKIGSAMDQGIHLAATRLLDRHGLHSTRATIALIRYIQERRIDLIHLHNLHGYYLNIEVLFRFLTDFGKPVVWTLHDCWPFTGHCAYFTRVNCQKWMIHCKKCPLTKFYPASYVVDGSSKNFSKKREVYDSLEDLTVVTVSSWLNNLVAKSILQRFRRETIHNGVDLASFNLMDKFIAKQRIGLSGKKVILGVANVWTEGKGLRIFKSIENNLPAGYTLVLVGGGLDDKQFSHPNTILVAQTGSQEELAIYYSAADVFVTPSIAETFGMVVAEALACGTPCVVRSGTAMDELISDSVGIKVSGGNPNDYLSAAIRLCEQPTKYSAQNCRVHAEINFSLEKRVNDYMRLYQSLLASNR